MTTQHVRMWIARIRYNHEDCILGPRCKKFKVSLQSTVFSIWKEKGKILTSSMHLMSGEDMDGFIDDLKKDKEVISVERKGDMFLLLEKAAVKAVQYYTPKLIFIKPVLQGKDGYEEWEIGSWQKETVSKFVNGAKKQADDFKLIKFTNENINEVFFPKLIPNLTTKQRLAVELAIENGYYDSPRKIELRQLAKKMKISLATYQQHLRVAEHKLIPNALYHT